MITAFKPLSIGAVSGVLVTWFIASGYYGAKIDYEISECNRIQEEAASDAVRLAREAEREAAQEQIARYARIAASQQKARQIVADALREAESKPAQIREVIRNVPRETMAEKCLDLPIPDSVLRELRD